MQRQALFIFRMMPEEVNAIAHLSYCHIDTTTKSMYGPWDVFFMSLQRVRELSTVILPHKNMLAVEILLKSHSIKISANSPRRESLGTSILCSKLSQT